MSAAEIIEQIKRLPAEDQQKIRQFINSGGAQPAAKSVEFIPRTDFESAANEIFKKYDMLFRKLAQ